MKVFFDFSQRFGATFSTANFRSLFFGALTRPFSVRKKIVEKKMGKDPRELFELKERIGKGSFGEVHRAIDKQTSKEVAIKIIDLEKSDG